MELGLSAGKPPHGSTMQMHTHKESFNKKPKSTAFLVLKVIWEGEKLKKKKRVSLFPHLYV